MVTAEERLKILTLIQDGKVTAAEGMRLLEAIDSTQKTRVELIESLKASKKEIKESARKLKEELKSVDLQNAAVKEEIKAETKRIKESIKGMTADIRKVVNESTGMKTPRWVNIHVTDTNTGKERVNVRLPVGVVTAGIKMGARFAPEVEGLNSDVLMEMINTGQTGMVADICDDEDCEHVEVFLE